MDMPYLVGVLSAWAVAQVLIGVFFVIAHLMAGRQTEYLPFGVLCFALALTSTGMAWSHAIHAADQWLVPGSIAHAGAIIAAAVNLHFVMRYAKVRHAGQIARAAYAIAGVGLALLVSGAWWAPDGFSIRTGRVLGYPVAHVVAHPTLLAFCFYLITVLEAAASQLLLLIVYRSGKREALFSCIGGLCVLVAAGNDVLLVTGTRVDSIYLLPHAFMLYAAGIASTLVFRYQVATGELHQVESTLRETTEELRHSHAELRELQDELVRKKQLAAVGELAAAIAHEVRNPLAIIVNAVASLRRQGIGDTDRQMLLGIVDEETARLNRLVNNLLRFARPVSVQRASVVLSELAQRAQLAVREHGVNVVVEERAPLQIPADANLLRMALDNLVENACHAVPAGRDVQIVLGPGEIDGAPCAKIEVRDRGHGMDQNVLARALDPFFTTRPSGTGLGLPIVQRITEAHGGKLELDSEPGRGTSARMLLPLQIEPRTGDRVSESAGGIA
jgi:signal transduction histidine kinase